MDEVLYAMSNPERSIEDAAASYGLVVKFYLGFCLLRQTAESLRGSRWLRPELVGLRIYRYE